MASEGTSVTITVRFMVISGLLLRKLIGGLAVLLPAMLAWRAGVQPSLSAYHGTAMRDVFVGMLCAIGVALSFYTGYGKRDRVAGLIAGLSIIVVAWVPFDHPTRALLHTLAAVVFFLTLAYMAWALFTLTDGNVTEQKIQRNAVYRGSAIVIVLCLVLAALGGPPFWLESVAVIAFGISWLVKGEAFLKDAP